MVKTKMKTGGYSSESADEYVIPEIPSQVLSVELEGMAEYVDGKRTKNIVAYRAWFSQQGLGPFQVKFLKKISLPPYLSEVVFEGLEAVEVHHNVYFRAQNISEVK